MDKKPIFFIGVPRSGTTILFEAFARHEDVGWLSNYTEKFPRFLFLNSLVRLFDNRFFYISSEKKQVKTVSWYNRILPKPAEAYPFWDAYTGVDFARRFLIGEEAENLGRKRTLSAINAHLRYQGKKRFATKITGPARILYLKSIFPDALFVHVIRDGRAVVNSLLNVDFWQKGEGFNKPWWDGEEIREAVGRWKENGSDPAVLAALQWKVIIDEARKESVSLPQGHYREVRYEEFINDDPVAIIRDLYGWAGLRNSSRFEKYLREKGSYTDMNRKYLKNLSPAVISAITNEMAPLLEELHYS